MKRYTESRFDGVDSIHFELPDRLRNRLGEDRFFLVDGSIGIIMN